MIPRDTPSLKFRCATRKELVGAAENAFADSLLFCADKIALLVDNFIYLLYTKIKGFAMEHQKNCENGRKHMHTRPAIDKI